MECESDGQDLKRRLEEARSQIELLEMKLTLSESQNESLRHLNCQLQTGKLALYLTRLLYYNKLHIAKGAMEAIIIFIITAC